MIKVCVCVCGGGTEKGLKMGSCAAYAMDDMQDALSVCQLRLDLCTAHTEDARMTVREFSFFYVRSEAESHGLCITCPGLLCLSS